MDNSMNSINLSSPELSPIIWKCIIDNTSFEFPQTIDELLEHYKNLDSYVSKMDFQTPLSTHVKEGEKDDLNQDINLIEGGI